MFFNPTNPEFSGKIVCADFHRAEKVVTVKKLLLANKSFWKTFLPFA